MRRSLTTVLQRLCSSDPAAERRATEAAAERRRNDHYSGTECSSRPWRAVRHDAIASNPGSTLGSLLAAGAGDVESKRNAGQLGNVVEGLAAPFARAKHTDLPMPGHDPDIVRP